MKKILLAVLACLAVVPSHAASPVGLGLTAGMNMSGQSFDLQTDTVNNSIIGFSGGVFAELEIIKPLSLQLEADFVMKGRQEVLNNFSYIDPGNGIFGTTTVTFTFHFNYFEIPLLVEANLPLDPLVKFSVKAGPYLGLLVNETTDMSQAANGDVPALSQSVDDTKFYPGTDFGLVFGAGMEYKNILLEVRYDLGLNSVLPTGYTDNTPPTNGVFSAMLGYRIL